MWSLCGPNPKNGHFRTEGVDRPLSNLFFFSIHPPPPFPPFFLSLQFTGLRTEFEVRVIGKPYLLRSTYAPRVYSTYMYVYTHTLYMYMYIYSFYKLADQVLGGFKDSDV